GSLPWSGSPAKFRQRPREGEHAHRARARVHQGLRTGKGGGSRRPHVVDDQEVLPPDRWRTLQGYPESARYVSPAFRGMQGGLALRGAVSPQQLHAQFQPPAAGNLGSEQRRLVIPPMTQSDVT